MTRQRKAPIIRSKGMSRRTMLRGALVGGGSVALALPLLDVMLDDHGEALANGSPLPQRLVTWFFGNGCALKDVNDTGAGIRFYPSATGPGYEVTEQLAPLAAAGVLDYCSVLSGFDVKAAQEHRRGHHDGCTFFSGHPFIQLDAGSANYSSKFGGPTVDQVAASYVGGETFLPSIQLQISKRIVGSEGPTLQYLSHKGPDQPLPQIANPQEVWDKLFASFIPEDDPAKPHRLAALDAVAEDAKRLQTRVGSADKARLEAHLESVAQIRGQIAAAAPECTEPALPGEANVDTDGVEPIANVNAVMSDLLALAFACDLTRVASVQFTGSVGGTVFTDIGMSMGHHAMSHESAHNDDIDAATIYTMERFAYLLQALRNTPEGSGNLLDNAVVLLGSDAAAGLTHSTFDQPCIVAGRGGGYLRYPGVHYRSPSAENTSDILLACLQALAPEISEVGGGYGLSSTPAAAILA
ncbi:DUF1552 domain-containing protein [Pseudenhygromyxa sp. WMMC2535]|uniref:DUF1552 domain-containing protein n=1 Tax=Pseudenhygromyxa sp. WMMC2535 TaxID=2712867 RepID=UPI0015579706|nr:DUF1552 domain-containing protein [Pseudenhygromyxa sp. WMMC2535]NVB38543.1 DUF1552 domain-containing protein [Pseudenhygromyxa sp. WMMC2535]